MAARATTDLPIDTTRASPTPELNLLCPAVLPTDASGGRTGNRDLWGHGCQIATA